MRESSYSENQLGNTEGQKTAHARAVPPRSKRENPLFSKPEVRELAAGSFTAGADKYDHVRPGYPAEVPRLLDAHAPQGIIADIGAGTGKLTKALDKMRPGAVIASDPSAQMLRILRASISTVPIWQATAEATGLQSDSLAAATSAQAWHWVDVAAASAELDRVITSDGCLLLTWNTIDVREPWVHRLTRIMHAGDVQRPGFYPEVARPWQLRDELRITWAQPLLAGELFDLMATRSYWLRASSSTREKMTANLDWYLYEHLALTPKTQVELPYRSDSFIYKRQQPSLN